MAIWFVVTFVVGYAARDLSFSFWLAILVLDGRSGAPSSSTSRSSGTTRTMNRLDREYGVDEGGRAMSAGTTQQAFTAQLKRSTRGTRGFVLFVVALAILEGGHAARMDRLRVPACHRAALRRHWRDESHV